MKRQPLTSLRELRDLPHPCHPRSLRSRPRRLAALGDLSTWWHFGTYPPYPCPRGFAAPSPAARGEVVSGQRHGERGYLTSDGSRKATSAAAMRSWAARAAIGDATSFIRMEKMSGLLPGAPTIPDKQLTLASVPVLART